MRTPRATQPVENGKRTRSPCHRTKSPTWLMLTCELRALGTVCNRTVTHQYMVTLFSTLLKSVVIFVFIYLFSCLFVSWFSVNSGEQRCSNAK